MSHCCQKDHRIPEFSGVLSATLAPPTPAKVVHGHCHHSATPTPKPRRLPASDQPPLRAPQPLPRRCHPRHISASVLPLRTRAPHGPRPFWRRRIRSQPGRRTYRPSPPAPAPGQFPRSMASLNAARPAQRTAAQYSNPTDQHRPTTPAIGRRPAQITPIDCPARSSGGTVQRTVFSARHAGLWSGGMGAVSDDI